MFASLHFMLSGDRTFGVLTKIDLMDQGTNAVDVSLHSDDSNTFYISLVKIIV